MWFFKKKQKLDEKDMPIVYLDEGGCITVNISKLVASPSGQRSLAAIKRLRENLQGKKHDNN